MPQSYYNGQAVKIVAYTIRADKKRYALIEYPSGAREWVLVSSIELK